MATKICAECGRKYESNYPSSKYCSNECGAKAQLRQQRESYRAKRKMIKKICVVCGKVITKPNRTKYCSDACLYKAKLERLEEWQKAHPKRKKKETLCWTCQNACGGCSWSRSFTPVEGWEAKPTKNEQTDSYRVISCPEFIPDEEREC